MARNQGGSRILVVDDDILVLEVVRTMLSSAGYQVVSTDDPRRALRLIWRDRFDLVLTDLGMPLVDGWTVARHAKATNAALPVLLVTGWGVQYEEEDLSKFGVDMVLSKPLSWASLTGAVIELLNRPLSSSEQRRYRRFRGMPSEPARLIVSGLSSSPLTVQMIDISLGGLSFWYHANRDLQRQGLEVEIASHRGPPVNLASCEVVYDVAASKEHHSKLSMPVRRCGIRFGELSAAEVSQLESVIRQHANGDE